MLDHNNLGDFIFLNVPHLSLEMPVEPELEENILSWGSFQCSGWGGFHVGWLSLVV